MGDTSIFIAECITFRDGILPFKNKLLNLEIGGNSKIVIDSYN